MPKLNNNEKYTREVTSRIANLTGLSNSAVRAVLDGLELCILDDLRTLSLNSDPDDRSNISLEIPNIGTLNLSKTFYPKEKSASGHTDGKSFRSKIELTDKFLSALRWSYYNRYDYLSQRTAANFSGLFNEHYQSIIQGRDEE